MKIVTETQNDVVINAVENDSSIESQWHKPEGHPRGVQPVAQCINATIRPRLAGILRPAGSVARVSCVFSAPTAADYPPADYGAYHREQKERADREGRERTAAPSLIDRVVCRMIPVKSTHSASKNALFVREVKHSPACPCGNAGVGSDGDRIDSALVSFQLPPDDVLAPAMWCMTITIDWSRETS